MAIDQRDRELAAAALRVRQAGGTPNRQQAAALRRVEKAQREAVFDEIVSAIPQKRWRQWSGRQARTINEKAERYDIPFGGAEINLPAVVKALHDFLRDNAARLAADEPTPEPEGLDLQRVEQAKLTQLKRRELERALLPRDEVRQAFDKAALRLRSAGDSLQRTFGPSAAEILNEAIDDALAFVSQLCSSDDDNDDS